MPFFIKGEKMKYLVILIVIFCIIAFFLLYPFKIKIYNEENNLFINVNGFVNLRVNLFAILDSKQLSNQDNSTFPFKLLKKIKIKELDLKLAGLNFDYRLNGGYYGLLCGVFATIKSICYGNDIKFNYELEYLGDKSIEFNSVLRTRIYNVLKIFKSV